jgi:solute carrier family 45 protein 1/2/4
MKSTIHSIWKNIFTLPPAIRSICYAQFFAWIGWFPILFYTSVWVGEIYTREAIARGGRSADDPLLPEEAVRAGSRALFMNSIVNLATSVFLPFLVSSSGIGTEVKPVSTSRDGSSGYRSREATNGSGNNGFAALGPNGSAGPNGECLTVRASRLMQKLDKIRAIIKVPSRLRMQLPIQGFTLIRAWILGQAVFAGTMFATWFAGSVWSAQAIICVNGFCWGVAQCESC